MAWDPDFIDFIDAYCDRWCERCPLTHKCAAFARQEDPDEMDDCAAAVEKAMESLREELAMPPARQRPSVEELLAPPEPSEREIQDYERASRARDERQRADPMMVRAREYSVEAHLWLRMYGGATREHAERARAAGGDALEAAVVKLEADAVLEALEVVTWDSVLISGKIYRAMDGKEWAEEDESVGDDPVQLDFNGSAKLALILAERSTAAWRLIARWGPEPEVAMRFAETLARLRHDVEVAFPNARQFRRPGFDDPPSL